MINGNLQAFLDKLALGMELEVSFRGRSYMIQGWDWSEDNPSAGPHIEMFSLGEDSGHDYEFRYDGYSRGDCTEAFLAAKIWDDMTFNEAEPEIEWVG